MPARNAINNYRKAQIFLGLLVFGTFATFGPDASAQSTHDISNRLNRLETEVETLGRAVYKGEEPPPGVFSGDGGASNADVEVRLQQLDSQVRALTGKVEEQDYQTRQLKEQLDRLTTDIDMRLNDLQGGGTGGSVTTSPIRSGTVDGLRNNGGAMQYQNRMQGQYQDGAQDVQQPETPANDGYQWKSGSNAAGGADTGGQLGTLSENDGGAVTSSADTAASLYEDAFALLKTAQYDEAEQGFKSFLGQYPDHALSGNATYWLGETYYVRGQFDKAAKTFAEGYQKDTKGPKAADNLLKMGLSLSGLGKKNDACVALGQIPKQFSTAGAVMSRAKQEMTRLGC